MIRGWKCCHHKGQQSSLINKRADYRAAAALSPLHKHKSSKQKKRLAARRGEAISELLQWFSRLSEPDNPSSAAPRCTTLWIPKGRLRELRDVSTRHLQKSQQKKRKTTTFNNVFTLIMSMQTFINVQLHCGRELFKSCDLTLIFRGKNVQTVSKFSLMEVIVSFERATNSDKMWKYQKIKVFKHKETLC